MLKEASSMTLLALLGRPGPHRRLSIEATRSLCRSLLYVQSAAKIKSGGYVIACDRPCRSAQSTLATEISIDGNKCLFIKIFDFMSRRTSL